jgi:hypothetical protein
LTPLCWKNFSAGEKRLEGSAWQQPKKLMPDYFNHPKLSRQCVDPRRDKWATNIRPALQKLPLSRQQKETVYRVEC